MPKKKKEPVQALPDPDARKEKIQTIINRMEEIKNRKKGGKK